MNNTMTFSPFIKQLYVAVPALLVGFSIGAALCYPTVLLQQLQATDSTIKIDFETATWMGSIQGLAGIPTVFMPALMQKIGRKFTFIIACLITIIGWVLAYTASSSTAILASESFHGFGTSSLMEISCLFLSEMISPKHRHAFIQIFFVLYSLGSTTMGLLTQYCCWKTISLIMLLPMSTSLLLTLTLPESPYWLAYKGNISKCRKNFVWLRGTTPDSKKELDEMTLKIVDKTKSAPTNPNSVTSFWKKISSKFFLMPASHIWVLQFIIQGSGSIVTLIYSIEMVKKLIANDEIAVFGAFIMNSLFCLGLCVSVILNKYFCTKPVLIYSGMCSILCLIVTSIFSYLQSVAVWPKESMAGLYCLSGYMFFCSIGMLGSSYSVASTLMPVENRGLGGTLMIINTNLNHAIALKSAPYMFSYLNMWGTCLIYAFVSIICLFIIWRFIPETKGKTLQEIENYYRFGSFSINNDNDANNELRILKSY